MSALLVSLGALVLAVLVSALIDPRPARSKRADPDFTEMGECAPAI